MTAPLDEKDIVVGMRVEKFTGEAKWHGVVVSEYQTTRGMRRFVVDVEPQGFQMIAIPSQLRPALAASPSQSMEIEVGATAWEGYWPGAGSISSTTKLTKDKNTAARWQDDGAEIEPLVTLSQAQSALAAMQAERDEAFAANERDRSIIADARSAFSAALERRSWLLHGGRGSYEWDDDRWKEEFGAAIDELKAPLDVLGKISIDWSLCPTSPEEIAAARIDWKARAEAAEAQVLRLTEENEALRKALEPFAKVAAAMQGNTSTKPDDWTAWGYNDADLLYGDFRLARTTLEGDAL